MPAAIDKKIKEGIIAEYALSNSVNGVAKKYNVSWATVRKIVVEAETQINVLREEKQKKYIHDAWDVINVYFVKLMDPKTIKDAKARDCVNVISSLLAGIQRQQELNQRFDVMYENIEHEHMDKLRNDLWDDRALAKELERFIKESQESNKKERKETLKVRINEKTLLLRDFKKEYEKKENVERKELDSLFDEVKQEILDEIYNEDDSDDE